MHIKRIVFSIFIFAFIFPIHEKHHAQYIVVLDPAGDARCTGRRIGDNFERGLTLQCAEKIKEYIDLHAPHIKVVITRVAGDTVYDLQNASLSNRIHADLFVNLNFYYAQESKPTLFLYQFSYGNDFAQCQHGLAFHSYEQAYIMHKNETDALCQIFKKVLVAEKYQNLCTVAGPYAVPVKPLIGITAPAVAIDVGIKNKELWHYYSQPLAEAIIAVVGNM